MFSLKLVIRWERNTRTIYTERLDEITGDFVSLPAGNTFKIHNIIAFPNEEGQEGRGIVTVEHFNGEVMQCWADAFWLNPKRW